MRVGVFPPYGRPLAPLAAELARLSAPRRRHSALLVSGVPPTYSVGYRQVWGWRLTKKTPPIVASHIHNFLKTPQYVTCRPEKKSAARYLHSSRDTGLIYRLARPPNFPPTFNWAKRTRKWIQSIC